MLRHETDNTRGDENLWEARFPDLIKDTQKSVGENIDKEFPKDTMGNDEHDYSTDKWESELCCLAMLNTLKHRKCLTRAVLD